MLRPILAAALAVAHGAQGQRAAEDDSMAFIQMNQMALGRRTASEDFEELFRAFDADKNGNLNMAELSNYLKRHWSAAATPAQARKIMRRSDTNADFILSVDEFLGCASDIKACESESPQIQQSAAEGQEAESGRSSPASSGLDISLTDFLPDEWASALRPGQVERCTERDRDLMQGHGLGLSMEDTGSEPVLDPMRAQTLQVRGKWVQTLLMPDACREHFSHAGRVDRPKHAQCLQDSTNITLPCARCNTNFFYNMVHNCANACTPSMNSKACVACTRPEKLMECVEGKARSAELQLAAEDFQGEAEAGGNTIVVGGDTPTGELIVLQKDPEEEQKEAVDAEGAGKSPEEEEENIEGLVEVKEVGVETSDASREKEEEVEEEEVEEEEEEEEEEKEGEEEEEPEEESQSEEVEEDEEEQER